jgi:hypothetical protein
VVTKRRRKRRRKRRKGEGIGGEGIWGIGTVMDIMGPGTHRGKDMDTDGGRHREKGMGVGDIGIAHVNDDRDLGNVPDPRLSIAAVAVSEDRSAIPSPNVLPIILTRSS